MSSQQQFTLVIPIVSTRKESGERVLEPHFKNSPINVSNPETPTPCYQIALKFNGHNFHLNPFNVDQRNTGPPPPYEEACAQHISAPGPYAISSNIHRVDPRAADGEIANSPISQERMASTKSHIHAKADSPLHAPKGSEKCSDTEFRSQGDGTAFFFPKMLRIGKPNKVTKSVRNPLPSKKNEKYLCPGCGKPISSRKDNVIRHQRFSCKRI